MKKLAILFICSIALFSCLRKESDLLGGNVTISGRLTRSCEDSTPMKHQVLNITDDFNFGISIMTDSNGYFNFTVPATSNKAYIRGNSAVLIAGRFCLKNQNIGTVFLNACVKAIVHYDTLSHKKNYSAPFGIKYDNVIIPKLNMKSLSKPDTIFCLRQGFWSENSKFTAYFFFNGKMDYTFPADSKEPLVPSYTYNHYTVKVP